jgi:NAD-dependent deacetylase
MKKELEQAITILSNSRKVVVSTGAGVSRESGIPTFRETQKGLWANFDPEELATLEGFLKNPAMVWNWYQDRIKQIKEVKPNPGHYAIAEMQDIFEEFYLITQNIDNLHQKAGSKNVCELHGNILQFKCLEENTIVENWPDTDQVPPRCGNCNGMIRPNVVWFGEALPEKELSFAFHIAANCDVMIVAGTSGLVQPAASLPLIAKRSSNASIIEVNPQKSAITPVADVFLQSTSGNILPELLEKLKHKF